MKNFKFMLIGASLLMAGLTISSCTEEDENLKNRVTVVEGITGEMKATLEHAITTGASIVDAKQNDDGSWVLTLSDGTVINIATGNAGGNTGGQGGSSVTVIDNATNIIITVDGKEYVLPKGGAGVQLIFAPEYADGQVILGSDGAEIRFLTNTAIDVDNTTFDIAEAHELKSRFGSELFTVKNPKMEGDMLVLTLNGGSCVAGATYAASVVANIGGSAAISNYFTVVVDDNFVDASEQIGEFTINAQYAPSAINDEGFCTATVPGDALVAGFDFASMFDQLPAGAKFEIGKQSAQPNDKAVEKWDVIAEALGEDGVFAWKRAPRTDFNVGDQHGFLLKVVANDVTKAKIYVEIDNPLANGDIDWFPGFKGQFEAEWHSRTEALQCGENAINLAEQFYVPNGKVYLGDGEGESVNPEFDINLIFGGKEFFDAYSDLVVTHPNGSVIIENNGINIVPTDYGKKFLAPDNEGIGWFNRGFNVDYQEGPDVLIWNDTKEEFSDKSAIGIDWWWGDPNGNATNIDNERSPLLVYYGIYIDNDGVLHTNSNYCGFAMRLAIGIYFDYAYGTKNLSAGDQFGLMFFNRRRQPAGCEQPNKNAF